VFTEIEPACRYQTPSEVIKQANRISDPPRYPTPSDRSAKSAIVVPAVVVAIMTTPYSSGWKRRGGDLGGDGGGENTYEHRA